MSDHGWSPEAREAVRSVVAAFTHPYDNEHAADILAALAPFVAARVAAAVQAEREACAALVEGVQEWRGQDYYCDSCKGGAIYPDAEDIAKRIRAWSAARAKEAGENAKL